MRFHPDTICPADAPEHVRYAFAQRCSDAYPKVRTVLRSHQLTRAEEDVIVDDVWLRAWPGFQRKLEAEQDALALGLPSPHHWDSYFCQIARRLVIDLKRRLGIFRRVRPSRAKGVLHATADGPDSSASVTGAPPAPRYRRVIPLSSNMRAPESTDPFLAADKAERIRILHAAIPTLTAQEQHALATSLRNLSDEDSAAELGVNRFSLYRLRRRAIVRLREVFQEHGYEVPTSTPTAWL